MPQVLNRRDLGPDWQPDSKTVLVDRTTKWGNPYRFDVTGYVTREEVIAKYRTYIQGVGYDLHELTGKDLVCWCAPKPCHADVLLELAN